MKKIYSLALTGLMVAGLSAQTKSGNFTGTATNRQITHVSHTSVDRVVGDTLLYIPLPEYIVDSVDAGAFNIQFNDQDGFAANASVSPPWTSGTNWLVLYTPAPSVAATAWDSLYHSDTSFVAGSTSWFTSPGQADDWITFGPVTIPATGATLGYRVFTPDGQFRDGYKVYVGSIDTDPTSFSASDVIFSRADNAGVLGEDTVWTYRTLPVPASFAGTQAYFAFQNIGNDMFILEMDQFVVKEANNAGIDNNAFEGFGFNQVMPNPATDFAYMNYSLGKTAEVTFMVTDMNGRTVATLYQGGKESGTYNYQLNVSEFNSGVYFVTLKAGQFSSTKKLMVTK